MSLPKVSILIPVFNRHEYIAQCIQSALDQTFTDFEVVIVDNASDDGTWEICQQFAAADKRVRIFRNESNIGPVRNWRRCAQEAKGEYSKILFSDDCLEPDCLREMVPRLDDMEVALVYCAARIGKSRDESVVCYTRFESSRISSTRFLNLVLYRKAPVSPGAALLRTHDLLNNLHLQFPTSTPREFEKNGAGPDVMILLLTAREYPYVAHISKPLVFFRAHEGSFTTGISNIAVNNGYRSALAFFLIKNLGRKAWIDYLARGWFKQRKHATDSWRGPAAYLIEYEGRGSVIEIVTLFFYALKNEMLKIFRNK